MSADPRALRLARARPRSSARRWPPLARIAVPGVGAAVGSRGSRPRSGPAPIATCPRCAAPSDDGSRMALRRGLRETAVPRVAGGPARARRVCGRLAITEGLSVHHHGAWRSRPAASASSRRFGAVRWRVQDVVGHGVGRERMEAAARRPVGRRVDVDAGGSHRRCASAACGPRRVAIVVMGGEVRASMCVVPVSMRLREGRRLVART